MRPASTQALDVRPAAALPRKALYLDGGGRMWIQTAANSLVVKRESGPPRQFPLARVDRVICSRNAHWSGEALLACLASGVPVTWIDGSGRAMGDCAPARGRCVPFAERIEAYLALAEWPTRYADWLRCRRLAVLRCWAEQRQAAGLTPARREFEDLKRAYVYRAGHSPFGEAGWAHSLTLAALAAEGLKKRYWGHGGQAFDLCADLADLLWAEFSLECRALPHAATQVRLVFFERWSNIGRLSLLNHLSDLKRHIAEVIE